MSELGDLPQPNSELSVSQKEGQMGLMMRRAQDVIGWVSNKRLKEPAIIVAATSSAIILSSVIGSTQPDTTIGFKTIGRFPDTQIIDLDSGHRLQIEDLQNPLVDDPYLSFDNNFYAHEAQGNIEIRDLNTNLTQEVSSMDSLLTHAEWNPQENTLAFLALSRRVDENKNQIFSIRPGEERQLLYETDMDISGFDWSPDGDHISITALEVRDGRTQYYMYAYDRNTQETVALGQGESPTWHPDSNQLAFLRDGNLYTTDLEGNEQMIVQRSEDYSVSEPVWSPNGNMIAFVANAGGYEKYGQVYDLDRNMVTNLGHGRGPMWSPDGSKIALLSYFGGPVGNIAIYSAQGNYINSIETKNMYEFYYYWPET